MPNLDLRTVMLLVSALTALMALVLALLRRDYPASIKGIGEWSTALVIGFVSTLLFGARGVIPDVWSIVIANMTISFGFALIYVGSQRFFGVEPRLRLWGGIALALGPFLAWFTFVQPHFGVRLAVMAGLLATVSGLHCRLIWRHGRRTFSTVLAAGMMAVQAAAQAARFASALGASANEGLFSQSALQTTYLASYVVCVFLLSVGLVLMANEKLLVEFRRLAALQETAHAERSQALAREAKRLEELDGLKNQFISNVSHELRTPLTLVLGPLDDLERDMANCGPAPKHSLDIVRRNAERLRELVEQLLDVTRLDSGGVKLHARRVDLAAFLRRTCERFQADAAQRGLTLDVTTTACEAWIFLDPDLIDKVISNLLSNALKFTPAGGRIRVELEPPPNVDDAQAPLVANLRVWVRDTGIGVHPREAARLFDRFFQASDIGERRREGTGIGLSLARGLVELHGGQMGVVSKPGEGAGFWFTLPTGSAHLSLEDIDIGACVEAFPLAPRSTAAGAAAENADTSLPLVLVVEDHADMRAYLASHLSALGRVVEAGNGRIGLDLARELRPQVIVSDVMMPEMDGIALCRAVRADPALRGTGLILVTAKACAEDRLEGLDAADEYLAKPFRMQELLAHVRNLLRRLEGQSAESAVLPAPRAAEVAEMPATERSAGAESDRILLQQMRAAVVARMTDPDYDVPQLAKILALSPRQLQRRCREVTGQGPLEFIRNVRMEEARALVQRGTFKTVGEIAAAVGMSAAYFGRLYTAWHGRSPSEELRGVGQKTADS